MEDIHKIRKIDIKNEEINKDLYCNDKINQMSILEMINDINLCSINNKSNLGYEKNCSINDVLKTNFYSDVNDLDVKFDNKLDNKNIFDDELNNIGIDCENCVKFLCSILMNLKDKKTLEYQKLTILYFIIGSLKLLLKDNFESYLLRELNLSNKDIIIYILEFSVLNKDNELLGFRGSNIIMSDHDYKYSGTHLASTYCAFAIFLMLQFNLISDDDNDEEHCEILKLKNIKFNSLTFSKYLNLHQNNDGSIRCSLHDSECDSRYAYCLLSIERIFFILRKEKQSLLLSIDREKLYEYLISCKTYNGGYAMIENGESNSGITYCTLSSIILLNKSIPNQKELIKFLIYRFTEDGVNGRINKLPDSCYVFWNYSSIINLIKYSKINIELDEIRKIAIEFLKECYFKDISAFSKLKTKFKKIPDVLHTFYSLFSLNKIIKDSQEYSNLNNSNNNNLLDCLLGIIYFFSKSITFFNILKIDLIHISII